MLLKQLLIFSYESIVKKIKNTIMIDDTPHYADYYINIV